MVITNGSPINVKRPVNPNLEKLSKGAWAVRDGEWALYFMMMVKINHSF